MSLQISSLQSALKIQKSLGAGLQGQIDTLLAAEEEQKQALNATSEALKQTMQEVKTLQSQAEDKEKLLQDAEHKITALEEQTAALETKAVELKAEAEVSVNAFQPVQCRLKYVLECCISVLDV